jgi:hypothetical protein
MNLFIDSGRLPGWRVKTISILFAFGMAVAVGCGKQSTPASGAAPPQNATVPATPTATTVSTAPTAPSQPAAPDAANDTQRVLQGLNRALMRWMIQNRRHPRTFEEFAATANTQIPAPPAGKKYALNARGFIVLVNISNQ